MLNSLVLSFVLFLSKMIRFLFNVEYISEWNCNNIFSYLFHRYVLANLVQIEKCKNFWSKKLPDFFRDRPKYLINYLRHQLEKAEQQFHSGMVVVVQEGKRFLVQSSSATSPGDTYNVCLDEFVTCSCPEYLRTELLCKHVFCLLVHGYIVWNDLPTTFR